LIAIFKDDDPQIAAVSTFIEDIEKLTNGNEIYFMDAVVLYCENNNIEIESVAKFIRKNAILKARIQEEAEELNFLKKTSRLPI